MTRSSWRVVECPSLKPNCSSGSALSLSVSCMRRMAMRRSYSLPRLEGGRSAGGSPEVSGLYLVLVWD